MEEQGIREGLTVVITGVSSGIGRGTAERLAAQGANVTLAARRTDVISKLANRLGTNAIAVTTDVSREEDMENLFNETMKAFGKIDVWINNAGTGVFGSFTEAPLRDHLRTIETNLLGEMYGSRLALRQFKEQGHGTLINIASFSSKVTTPFAAAYTGSKQAIAGLTAGLYQEMALEDWKDIHVCMVHPWVTDTPWTVHAGNYTGHEISLKPMDDPETVIDAIIGLIDDPEESVEIGVKVKGAATGGDLLANLTSKLTGKSMLQMEEGAPPAPHTSGNLHEPVAEGTGVSGGNRERMEREQREE
ncbi:SDR family NAD(P)-dependent oxidoreductase [Planococcus lenghuensis]|uniref:Oxidoreductase n=1 Tax=Planococcus lenghuensis TaxID=2213202 RepID=A0A1Q2L281_9BACL|nr:SDR family NAD(P)-dependent oxidoreductase [Planococcus lenghuensis]AQQ54575.1 oxidoreductase [Planococcus lenghuensis]